MLHGCGINAWETNSQIVHIVGDSPLGPFVRQEVTWPAFAHEPDVVRAPNGDWVMMFSSFPYNATGLARVVCNNCSDGTTPAPGTPGCPFQRGSPKSLGHTMIQMLATAPSPHGPWKSVQVPQLTVPWDWNTALTINDDNSAVALIRGGMVWHADNYADPSAWHPVGNPAGKSQGPSWVMAGGVEDPYIWRDDSGVYHALAHAFSPFFGVHAFSEASQWPANWTSGEPMNWTVTGVAYDATVAFTDGTNFSFSRRERPHLAWARGETGRLPLALTNGVQYGGPPNTPDVDSVLTLSQGVA